MKLSCLSRISRNVLPFTVAAAFAMSAHGSQPYSYCWFPEDLLAWNGTDNLLRYNRSKIKLRERAPLSAEMAANANQGVRGQITDATILYPRCSAAPSQGDFTFTAYQPTYWQYIDKLVYWAGSASEGIILPPPASATDAAHLSGVKVLGQVFFPPSYYGGKREWVTQMLTHEGDVYPYAVKLFEVARDLGFDGWFINEETGGGSSEDWRGFVACFNAAADAAGYTDMEIQWYNASRTPNTTILKAHKNTSQFLEYGSVGDKRDYASKLNCTEDETFSKLYAGIECVKGGLTGYGSLLEKAFPASGHVCSVALFCPEEHSWKDHVRDLLGSKDTGAEAHAAVSEVFKSEEKMWVNTKGDPSAVASGWKGISGYIMERTPVMSVPFRTDFCVGVGKGRYRDGILISDADWNHTGMQSVLPTWRWWIENRGSLQVDIDWDHAYALANSFHIHGEPGQGSVLMRLYKTLITIGESLRVELVCDGAAPDLALSTRQSLQPDVFLAPVSSEPCGENGWHKATYDLSDLAGKTIHMIGLDLKKASGEKEISLRLGSLAILPQRSLAAPEIKDPMLTPALGQEKGELGVTWDFEPNDDLDYFEITVEDNGKILAAGHTRGGGFHFPDIPRSASGKVDVNLKAVLKDGTKGTPTVLKAEFEALKTPEIAIKLSKSYLEVGESAVITAKATNFPTSYEWEIPATLEILDKPSENSVTVKALGKGLQKVGVRVSNEVGCSFAEQEMIDVLDKDDIANVKNVALGKTITDFSGCTNSKETPANLLDGVTSPASLSDKWCALDSSNWVIIDCEDNYRFYGFKIYDCKAGPEDAENFHAYTIELSGDGKDWRKVLAERDREGDDIKEDWIPPTEGRFIRFSPEVAGVLRVWEFEAYGRAGTSGIEDAPVCSGKSVKAIYSPQGFRIKEMQPGINIILYSDGTVMKVRV